MSNDYQPTEESKVWDFAAAALKHGRYLERERIRAAVSKFGNNCRKDDILAVIDGNKSPEPDSPTQPAADLDDAEIHLAVIDLLKQASPSRRLTIIDMVRMYFNDEPTTQPGLGARSGTIHQGDV